MRRFFLVGLILFVNAASVFGEVQGGFLFVTFKGESTPMTEQIYFGLSRDGRKWEALHGSEPVLVSKVGEQGVRDPYLLRDHDGKKFILLATDLCIHRNGDWNRATHAGSKSLVIWESPDLVLWSDARLVRVAADDAGCTWAPEAQYDSQTGDYLVFWASTTAADRFSKQRIWAARTKDFIIFGKPFIYIDHPHDVIDTDIVECQGSYYRFSKDEKLKAITMESSKNLMGPWRDVSEFSLSHLQGYEGPTCFLVQPGAADEPGTWCLMLDHYSKGSGYEPFTTDNLAGGSFKVASDFSFPFRFRHGTALRLTQAEYHRVRTAYARQSDTSALR